VGVGFSGHVGSGRSRPRWYRPRVETTTQTSKRCEVVVVCSGMIYLRARNAGGKDTNPNPSIRDHSPGCRRQRLLPLRPTPLRSRPQRRPRPFTAVCTYSALLALLSRFFFFFTSINIFCFQQWGSTYVSTISHSAFRVTVPQIMLKRGYQLGDLV
jgi:hypothetical protein